MVDGHGKDERGKTSKEFTETRCQVFGKNFMLPARSEKGRGCLQ